MPLNDPLTDEDRQRYQWQIWVSDFGEQGQQRLKDATVLVSRCGGLGGVVAYELAAAGVGRLILAHAGNLRVDDLNRQILMSHRELGQPRVAQAKRRLLEFNPGLRVETVAENISEENAERLVGQADVVMDCAPLFEERFLLNREVVRQNKAMIECAMYDLEAHCTTILPGTTPCLRCMYPQAPAKWKRQFPVFGAVSGTIGCIGAMEAVKLIAGFGELLAGWLLVCDLREMSFRRIRLRRDPQCAQCADVLADGRPKAPHSETGKST